MRNSSKNFSGNTPLEESPRTSTGQNSREPTNMFGSTPASHWLKHLTEGSEDIFSTVRLRRVESKMFFKVALEISRTLMWAPVSIIEKYEMRLAFILIAFEYVQRFESMSVFDDRVNPNTYLIFEILSTYLGLLKSEENNTEILIQCRNSWQQRVDNDQTTYGQLTYRASKTAREKQETLKELIDYILIVEGPKYITPTQRKRSSEDARGYQNNSLTPKFRPEKLRVSLSEVSEEILEKLLRLQPSERKAFLQSE
jgi:hypothetical protein